MGKGQDQESELERELDELYRKVAGNEPRQDVALSDAAVRKSQTHPRTPYLAAGLVFTGLILIGIGLFSWFVTGPNQPLGFRWTEFLRMAGWSAGQTTYLTRPDGLRQPVPPEAVILNLEGATGPPAPAPPARDPQLSLEPPPPIKKPVVPVEEPPAAISGPSVPPKGPLPSVREPSPPADEPTPSLGKSSLSTEEIGKREGRLRIFTAPKERRRGSYAVQIRAYPENRKREAMAFTEDVRKKESQVSMETVSIPGRGVWHRILIGDFATAEEATEYRETRHLAREYPYSFIQTKSGDRP